MNDRRSFDEAAGWQEAAEHLSNEELMEALRLGSQIRSGGEDYENQPGIVIGTDSYVIRGEGGKVVQEWKYPTCKELAATGEFDRIGSDGERERYAGQKFCIECGGAIPKGALYCQVDAPYGLMHWIRYFSPLGVLLDWAVSQGRRG